MQADFQQNRASLKAAREVEVELRRHREDVQVLARREGSHNYIVMAAEKGAITI